MRGDGPCGHMPAQAGEAMSIMGSPLIGGPAPKRRPRKKKKGDDYNTFKGVAKWIMDTGSGVDICGQECVPVNGSGLVYPEMMTVFHTANGSVDAGPVFPGILNPFAEAIAPYVLESTPNLLTVGKRCMKKGYGFFWFPWKAPYMITPKNEIFVLEVIDNVPYLRADACPSPPLGLGGIATSGQRQMSRGKYNGLSRVDSWIMDSGSGHDLMSRYLAGKKAIRKAVTPLSFFTANGVADADKVCDDRLSVLNERVRAYLLDNTPAVLSLGARCMQHGYGFYWFPYELPYLVCPVDGKHIQLQLDNYVPRLPAKLDNTVVKLGYREVPIPWAPRTAVPAPEAEAISEKDDSSSESCGSDSSCSSDEDEGPVEEEPARPAKRDGEPASEAPSSGSGCKLVEKESPAPMGDVDETDIPIDQQVLLKAKAMSK